MRFVVCLLAVVLSALPGRADLEDNGDGTVTDPSSGLQWTQRGNGEDITVINAAAFCEALELVDFDDWRLPTLDEAVLLFRPDSEPKNSYDYRGKAYPLRIDDAFVLTAPGIWTSSMSYRGAPTAYLYSSGKDFSSRGEHKNFQRVLCNRDR